MHQDNFSTRILTPSSTSRWNRSDDKLFEKALVIFPEHLPDRWQTIAGHLGRSIEEVKEHYEILVHDVSEIDAGRVALPNYADDDLFESSWDSQMTDSNQISFAPKSKQSDPERKKGTPWTPEEHKLFLLGLKQYGKGDWRSISRNVVVTRTPTQVASHAQKYFLRHNNSVQKERKRSSIHDITTVAVDNNSVDQNWIAPPPQTSVILPNHSMMEYQNYGFPS